MTRLLVLVTGAGRSGTSTMAGLLHHLGLDVPGPFLAANESNPKGFFESRWSKRFHTRLLDRAGVHLTDSRPEALALVAAAVDDDTRARLDAFLAEHGDADQLVVKDPRSIWTQALWTEAAARAGREIRFVTMLRHPAEVVGSRSTYYTESAAPEAEQRRLEVLNLARWVNNALVAERGTRGHPRVLVRYHDLLADWRAVTARLVDGLGIDPAGDLAPPHPADDFVDPSLSRHPVTWDDLAMPTDLRDVAQAVWERQTGLADAGGAYAGLEHALDDLAAAYARLLADADAVASEVSAARTRAALAEAPASGAGTSLDSVGGRRLARELGRRVSARARSLAGRGR